MFFKEDFPIGSYFYWVRIIKFPHLKKKYVVKSKFQVKEISPEGYILYEIPVKNKHIVVGAFDLNLIKGKENQILVPEKIFLNQECHLSLLLGSLASYPLDLVLDKAKYSFKEFMQLSKSPLFELKNKDLAINF